MNTTAILTRTATTVGLAVAALFLAGGQATADDDIRVPADVNVPVSGAQVDIFRTDVQSAPVPGAQIDIYRTDVQSTPTSTPN